MVASVPEFVNRTMSKEGTRWHSSWASCTSTGLAAATDVPRASCSATAAVTFGCAWPRIKAE